VTDRADSDFVPSGLASGERNPALRTLDLLIWMASETPPWSVRSAARALGTSPPSVHRLLNTLESRELVWRDEHGQYFPGHALIRVAQSFGRQVSIKQLARPHLEELAKRTTEASLLTQVDLQRPAMMFVDLILADHPITYITKTYEWKPLHSGASGLSILAALSDEDLAAFFDRVELTPVTSRTKTSRAAVRREIQAIKQRGYGITRGQRTAGAVGMAVPYFDAQQRVAGSLCLTIPEQRFDAAREDDFAKFLIDGADRISHDLQSAGLTGRSGPFEEGT
jgi:IclR family transcriptional regulator, acetate operon repressor